jgi:hypothetical protein
VVRGFLLSVFGFLGELAAQVGAAVDVIQKRLGLKDSSREHHEHKREPRD